MREGDDMIGNREALDGVYAEATLSPLLASLTSTDACIAPANAGTHKFAKLGELTFFLIINSCF